MNRTYKYQMHTHTSPCSRCAVMQPEELCAALYEGGFQGAILTNHFFGGNSGIERSLSWAEFVKAYEDDYNACRLAAEKYDLDIIFGVEEHLFGGKEILCYGITPELLYEHPELADRRAEDWKKVLHGVGALIIQAHPYRVRGYITEPGPLPFELIDGIEVYNAANAHEENELAEALAKEHPELILTSGADTHSKHMVTLGGIECHRRIRNERELALVLKSGDYNILK